ncbi:MAG: AmmeMemoRadiSam system protein B [Phycisphaerae bacterium]
MKDGTELRPKIRPVEAFPVPGDAEGMFAVRDPSGISEQVLSMSEPALFILSQFDGCNTLNDVAKAVASRYGQVVQQSTLVEMVGKLESGLMLEGPAFKAHMDELLAEYRSAKVRPSILGNELGGPESAKAYLSKLLPLDDGEAAMGGEVVGLVAPHLDFPRGEPCYREAYRTLRGRQCPKRVCVLGTNHFGRATSVVATAKAFETPLGVTEVDTDFLEQVEQRCGHDLREHEFDHKREHSVELQVLCLQHVFGAKSFKLVPFLCHDPCGPTGTRPVDGRGVDLGDFAEALGAVIAQDGGDTLLVASADLSHVGSRFGDQFQLDEAFLESLARRDRGALSRLAASEPEGFVQVLADDENATRVCSAGCIYVVGQVLRDAKVTMLRYHQAFTEEQQICVSCTAMTYVR